MFDPLPQGTSLWLFLLHIDQDLAERARREGCACGGRLHCANYPRKPRGCPDGLPEEYAYRLSFCCDRDGCRKRVTPPSVRFLGRKVYLGVLVVLIAAMRHGATGRRVRELSKLIGADRATISRWRRFWREHFPETPFWKIARGHFASDIEIAELPRVLVKAFFCSRDPYGSLGRLLLFLSPITIPGGTRNQHLVMTISAPQKMHPEGS